MFCLLLVKLIYYSLEIFYLEFCSFSKGEAAFYIYLYIISLFIYISYVYTEYFSIWLSSDSYSSVNYLFI
jgi:hypothetical protein